jgi:transcriptional regulator with XRE-family HTH domain
MTQPQRVLVGLGAALRKARLDRGLSQEELGLQTGVHRNYIGGVERGERSPTVLTVAKLAGALDVSLGQLFKQVEEASELL